MKKIYFFFPALLFALSSFAYNGTTVFTIPASLQSNPFNINACQLTQDNSGKLLFTSNGAGIISFDGSNFANFNTSNSSLASNRTKDIFVDANNLYYVASDSGMSIYNGATWTNYSPTNSGIVSANLKCIYAKNNSVYMGGYKGFSIYNNGVFTNYTTANSGLSSDTINDFLIDANNDLWIATANGLCKWSGNVFTVYSTSNSALKNSEVSALLEDGNKLLLLGGATIQILQNNIFTELSLINGSPAETNIIQCFTKGFNGIILNIDAKSNQLFEVQQNVIKSYFLHGINLAITKSFIYVSATNTFWIPGAFNQFASFSRNNYNSTITGNTSSFPSAPPVTIENCKALDINQVNQAILGLGDMSWNINDVKFEVPKGSRKHCVLANSLWMGGVDPSGNLRVAAQTYRQNGTDYWPGPLDTISGNTDTAKSAEYNKIWKINRWDIELFKTNFQNGSVQNGSFVPAFDILTWPAQGTGNYSRNMAPFVDLNQDGIYNPLVGGDYPLIKGDQMLYSIFNDNLAQHTESDGLPIKVEVHASAYAFACNGLTTNDSIINYSTFYNYKIFNRSQLSLDSAFFANWIDFDIGNATNDGYGSNVQNNFVYGYNADSIDDGNGENKYGLHPPIMSSVILNGPLAYLNDGIDNNNNGSIDEPAEKNGMTKAIFYKNDFTTAGNPTNTPQYYQYLKALWKNNTPLTVGGNGFGGTIPTHFIWPDFPSASSGWHYPASTFIDGRMVQSCGPFHFAAGASVDFDFAFVFSRDTSLIYNSAAYYNKAVTDVQKIKYWFDNNNVPSCLPIYPGINEQSKKQQQLLLYPNPAEKYHTNSISKRC